jgi:hypothetical protein
LPPPGKSDFSIAIHVRHANPVLGISFLELGFARQFAMAQVLHQIQINQSFFEFAGGIGSDGAIVKEVWIFGIALDRAIQLDSGLLWFASRNAFLQNRNVNTRACDSAEQY